MESIDLIVLNDTHINKYITVLRKATGKPIGEIKDSILKSIPVLKCDYYDQEELSNLVKIVERLSSLGAKIEIYESNREISVEMVKNLIDTYEGIARDRERMDDLLYDEE